MASHQSSVTTKNVAPKNPDPVRVRTYELQSFLAWIKFSGFSVFNFICVDEEFFEALDRLKTWKKNFVVIRPPTQKKMN